MKNYAPEEFEKFNIRVGTIKAAKQHPEADEYILLIDLGYADQDMQIVASLKDTYTMDELVGQQCLVVENIEPITVAGVESQGLLLISRKDDKPVLLKPDKEIIPGVRVYGIHDGETAYEDVPGE